MSTTRIINTGASFVADGSTVDFVPTIDIEAGTIVVIGKLVGIAKFGIRANTRGSITVRGVFDVVKDPTTNIPAGTTLYWSLVSWHVVKNAYSHSMIGKSIEDAPPGTITVRLRMNQ